MGNSQKETQYARFIKGTEEPGYSAHLCSFLNEDPNIVTGPLNDRVTTVVDAFHESCNIRPHKDFLGWRDKTKEGQPYVWKTWQECREYVDNLARGIQSLEMMEDIQSEGKTWRFMGIYGKNRAEWVLTDLAAATLGGTTIAFYDTLGPAAIEFVIKQTELTTITCTSAQLSQLIILKNQGKANSIKFLISMDDYDYSVQADGKDAGLTIMHINEVIEHGRKHKNIELNQFKPKSDDIYMFCYTSGTTGDPKAAMLSHKNLVSTSSAAMQTSGINLGDEDSMISYLPLAHSFEKAMFCMCLLSGMKIGYYNGDPLKLLDDLKVLQPTAFPSVPRLFNRIYDKIQAGIKEKSPMQQAIVNRAINSKLKHLKNGAYYNHSVWDNVVFNKFKSLIGGNVRIMITGSAPINPDVLSFLKICFCSPIHEGYGQTESSAASCITSAFDPEAGHVGGPVSSIRIRLRDIPEMQYLSTDKPNPRGEICYQGNSIFQGYFKNADKTKEALSEDGWLASGDVGMVFPNGSIRIIDRAKNIFKLAQGEYIAPEKLENVYIQSPYMAQIFVHGESTEAWLMAVGVVEKPQIKKLALEKGWITNEDQDLKELYTKPELHKAIIENFNELAKANKLSGLEKIKKLHLLDDPFTIENDILTPTFKIKRNIAKNIFKEQITAIYAAGPN